MLHASPRVPSPPAISKASVIETPAPTTIPPLVSVIVAGYNQGQYISEALDSVFNQDYPNLEVIIVDNGSTDQTLMSIEPYLAKGNVRLYRYETNAPITQRLNAAVAASSGQFISLLYADDLYLPQKIARQVRRFEELPNGYGVVYSPGLRRNELSGAEWLDPSITESGDILLCLLEARGLGQFINPISPLSRRECYVMHPFYEDMFVEGESHYFRIATTHHFSYMPEPLVLMREHDDNMGKAVKKNLQTLDESLKRLGHLPTFPREAHALLRRSRAKLHSNVGWIALRTAEDGPWVRWCLRGAVKLDLRELLNPRVVTGYVLASLPPSAIRRLNRVGYRLRPPSESITFKEDY